MTTRVPSVGKLDREAGARGFDGGKGDPRDVGSGVGVDRRGSTVAEGIDEGANFGTVAFVLARQAATGASGGATSVEAERAEVVENGAATSAQDLEVLLRQARV